MGHQHFGLLDIIKYKNQFGISRAKKIMLQKICVKLLNYINSSLLIYDNFCSLFQIIFNQFVFEILLCLNICIVTYCLIRKWFKNLNFTTDELQSKLRNTFHVSLRSHSVYLIMFMLFDCNTERFPQAREEMKLTIFSVMNRELIRVI